MRKTILITLCALFLFSSCAPMTTQNSVKSQGESSQVVVEEKEIVVSKNESKHVPVKKSITVKLKIKKSTTVKRKTSVKEVSGKSDHRYDPEEREEVSETKDNRGDRKEKIQSEHGSNRSEPSRIIPQVHKIQPEHGSNRIEPSQIIPQVEGASAPDEMPVLTETSDEKSKTEPDEMPVSIETSDEKSKTVEKEKEDEFWEILFKETSEEDKTSRSHTALKQKEKGASVDISGKDETSQDYLWQIFVNPEQSSAKRFIIKKIDGTKKRPVQVQIEDLLRYRWFSCTESNYGWEWKFLPERKLKSIAYVRYMDEDPAIYGAYKCAANVITVRLEGRSCQYRPYYINKWIPLVLYPIKTGQDRSYWWGNFFIPIED